MRFFNEWGRFMMAGAGALARWEIDNARTIMGSRKRLFIIGKAYYICCIIFFSKIIINLLNIDII